MNTRAIGAAVGAALGVTVGGLWWWVWACRMCAPGLELFAPMSAAGLFGAVAGALLAPRRDADGRLY
ncbi:MAG: hypothetical protein ABMA64_21470 [Myxococcota bacterium]